MSLYEVFFDLTRLEIHLWDRVDQALRAECGIPLGRLEAMLVMRRLGACRVQDVSRALSVTVGGTSKLVDRIEASEYCVRSPNPDDDRSSLITLTASAEPLIERAEAVIESTLQVLLSEHLAEEDLQSLRRQLRHLRRVSASISAQGAPGPPRGGAAGASPRIRVTVAAKDRADLEDGEP